MLNEVAALAGALEAVLEAAAEWVAAQEALVAAQQVSDDVEAEEETVGLAGSRLVAAVNRWRCCQEPSPPAVRTRGAFQTNASDAMAEFIARGGTVTLCPTASVADGSAAPPSEDRKRLTEHHLQRAATSTLRWGPQRERLRTAAKPAQHERLKSRSS